MEPGLQDKIRDLTSTKYKVFFENLNPEVGAKELMEGCCKLGRKTIMQTQNHENAFWAIVRETIFDNIEKMR